MKQGGFEMRLLKDFIKERCLVENNAEVGLDEIYESFKEYWTGVYGKDVTDWWLEVPSRSRFSLSITRKYKRVPVKIKGICLR